MKVVAKTNDEDLDETAALADALAHPIRVAMIQVLRKERKIAAADLRRAVSSLYGEIDTRNLQFHLYKMQSARVLTVVREGGRDVVTLERDVIVRARTL